MIDSETFLGGRIVLHAGDCLDVLDTLPENSIDGCVCDPPYFLPSVAERFGKDGSAVAKCRSYSEGTALNGFVGKPEIVSDIAFRAETWAKVFRVLKPGAHLFAFSAASNFGGLQAAVAAGGFDHRNAILQMIDESGKARALLESLNDAQRCALLDLIVEQSRVGMLLAWVYGSGFPKGKPLAKFLDRKYLGAWCDADELARGPVSHMAAFYADRDVALKPAFEPIVMARKPLDGTLAENIARWGTGSLNIDGCRVNDRHPSNVMLAPGVPADALPPFYYSAKADADDRLGSKHPTVKPVDLMQYVARLGTSPGQTILDPFAGTGTTGEAAWREGLRAILIERDAEYQADIRRRMALCMAGPDERKRESIKAKIGDQPFEAGSLFAPL